MGDFFFGESGKHLPLPEEPPEYIDWPFSNLNSLDKKLLCKTIRFGQTINIILRAAI